MALACIFYLIKIFVFLSNGYITEPVSDLRRMGFLGAVAEVVEQGYAVTNSSNSTEINTNLTYTEVFKFDKTGNLTERLFRNNTDSRSIREVYTYNTQNRLTGSWHYSAGTLNYYIQNHYKNGQLVARETFKHDSTLKSRTEFDYNDNGQLLLETVFVSQQNNNKAKQLGAKKLFYNSYGDTTKVLMLDHSGNVKLRLESQYDRNRFLIKKTSYAANNSVIKSESRTYSLRNDTLRVSYKVQQGEAYIIEYLGVKVAQPERFINQKCIELAGNLYLVVQVVTPGGKVFNEFDAHYTTVTKREVFGGTTETYKWQVAYDEFNNPVKVEAYNLEGQVSAITQRVFHYYKDN